MTLTVYKILLYILLPFTLLKLLWRARKQPEYLQHWAERYGFYKQARVQSIDKLSHKPVIWLHCVSVGETRAAAPLVITLLQEYPNHQILLTHTTPTGRATSEQLFGDSIQRVYLPYDVPFAVHGFLKHFKPAVGVLMETELWFNLIAACKQQGVPLLLVNARLSEKSARGYARVGKIVRQGLQNLAEISAQTLTDAKRLQQLGGQKISVAGNLKFEVMPPENAFIAGQQLRTLLGKDRPVFLAASTREGEEALILDAIILDAAVLDAAVLDTVVQIPNLLTVIVPRHPQRFNEVEALLQSRGIQYQKRSALQKGVNKYTRVILGDTMGELFTYYASADICLVGGSLLPCGGQNLIEAMRMAKPVLIGAHTYNFKEVSALAVAQGAALRVDGVADIRQAIQSLVKNPQKQAEMGAAGLAICMASQGATEKTRALIAKHIK